jgi:hypothetical protein
VQFTGFLSVADTKKQLGFPFYAARLDFTIQTAGRIEVEIDWTHASNPIFIGMYRGVCPTVQFGSVTAGTYEIWTANRGDTAEAGVYRVYLIQ